MNALQVIDISNNLGDAKSLITHPATTTHRRLAPEARAGGRASPTASLRVSVGLEDARDLVEDLAARPWGPARADAPCTAAAAGRRRQRCRSGGSQASAATAAPTEATAHSRPCQANVPDGDLDPALAAPLAPQQGASEAQIVTSGPQLTPISRAISRPGSELATGSRAR